MTIDRRGRHRGTLALFNYGFRPFFLGAALHAATVVPLWLWLYQSGKDVPGPFVGSAWHAHEMIFGYLGAVMAGFILTAIPNWTGRLPLSGAPLALLFALWLVGRVACATITAPLPALFLDLAFPAMLSIAIWREIAAGRNWRNAPVAILLTLFFAANLLHHLEAFVPALEGRAIRLALSVAALLMALIGGRIIPSFTRNWLVKAGSSHLPAPFGALDKAALIITALALAGWNAMPDNTVSGMLLTLAGTTVVLRLARWRGLATWQEPIVLVLHIGYSWLSLSLLLLGTGILAPEMVPTSAAIHALTAGAIGTMTLAVMTRATLGHTGRTIETNIATAMLFSVVTVGALLRVAALFDSEWYRELLIAGGVLWSFAFALFVIAYGPMLFKRRWATK